MEPQPHLDLVNEAWNEVIEEMDARYRNRPEPSAGASWLDRCKANAIRHDLEGREDAIKGNGHGNGTPGVDGGGLPKDASARKQTPVFSGVLMYFPDAIAEVAQCSWQGNEQHNPGTALHWDRAKSGDEHDALVRHLMEAGKVDSDGIRHSAKVAWRALAALQKEIEKSREINDIGPL